MRDPLWDNSRHSPAGFDPTDYWGDTLDLAGHCWVCWIGWPHDGDCGAMAASLGRTVLRVGDAEMTICTTAIRLPAQLALAEPPASSDP